MFLVFMLAESVYAYINGNSLKVILLQLRQYKYIFIFVLLFLYHSDELFSFVFKSSKMIAFISIPVSIVQRLTNESHSGDVVTGLFGYGASGIMSLFLSILLFTELSARIVSGRTILGLYLLYVIPIFLNETKIVFVIMPIMLIIMLIITKKFNFATLLLLLTCIPIFFYVGGYVYKTLYTNDISTIFSRDYILEYMNEESEYDIGRVRKIEIAYELISKSPSHLAFGYGIGSGYTGDYSGNNGIISEKYYAKNLFGGTRPQIFNSLIDTGLVGIVLQFLLALTLLFRIASSERKGHLCYYMAVFSIIVWLLGLFYLDIMTVPNLIFVMMTSIYMTCIQYPAQAQDGCEGFGAGMESNSGGMKETDYILLK